MVIAYGGKHQPRGFFLLGANMSPSNRQGHVRALSVYAAAEKNSTGTETGRSWAERDCRPRHGGLPDRALGRKPRRCGALCAIAACRCGKHLVPGFTRLSFSRAAISTWD